MSSLAVHPFRGDDASERKKTKGWNQKSLHFIYRNQFHILHFIKQFQTKILFSSFPEDPLARCGPGCNLFARRRARQRFLQQRVSGWALEAFFADMYDAIVWMALRMNKPSHDDRIVAADHFRWQMAIATMPLDSRICLMRVRSFMELYTHRCMTIFCRSTSGVF
jgi:hypothetical protein